MDVVRVTANDGDPDAAEPVSPAHTRRLHRKMDQDKDGNIGYVSRPGSGRKRSQLVFW